MIIKYQAFGLAFFYHRPEGRCFTNDRINKEPTKIKEIGFKDRTWINQYASQSFVIKALSKIEAKDTNSFKRKI